MSKSGQKDFCFAPYALWRPLPNNNIMCIHVTLWHTHMQFCLVMVHSYCCYMLSSVHYVSHFMFRSYLYSSWMRSRAIACLIIGLICIIVASAVTVSHYCFYYSVWLFYTQPSGLNQLVAHMCVICPCLLVVQPALGVTVGERYVHVHVVMLVAEVSSLYTIIQTTPTPPSHSASNNIDATKQLYLFNVSVCHVL
jgi:hypothetical protein